MKEHEVTLGLPFDKWSDDQFRAFVNRNPGLVGSCKLVSKRFTSLMRKPFYQSYMSRKEA